MKSKSRRSIQFKITRMVVSVSLLSVLLCAGIAFFGMRTLIETAEKSSRSLGKMAADDSEKALMNREKEHLLSQVRQRTSLTEERFKKIQEQVWMMAGYLTAVYSSPDEYVPVKVEKPSMANAGKWALQYSLVEGTEYSLVQQEINLAGNMLHMAVPLCEENDTVSSVYFSSSNGFMVSYDKNSDNMFEGKEEGEASEVFRDHFDPRKRDWYLKAVTTRKTVFKEPYLDTFGRLLISCAAPVYGRDGQEVGVLAMDILIENINNEIISSHAEGGSAILINSHGYVVAAPGLEVKDGEYESVNLLKNEELAELAQNMTEGEEGVISVSCGGKMLLAAYSPISLADWSMAVLLPEDTVTAPARESYEEIMNYTGESVAWMEKETRVTLFRFLTALAAVLLLVAFLSRLNSKKITKPIRQLTREVGIIARGELDHVVEVSTGDELETLGDAFNHMTGSLNEYIVNLADVRADRERIATELSVATTIQASMLPCIFPAFPNRTEFDIYADMHPAREVGGDFYDFFQTDDNHLWVVIADVSGKGIPAALFMVIAKTMLKNHAEFCGSPAQILRAVNERLCESNEADMFVTAFIGVLEVSNGCFTFSNAGHNYPLIYRKGEMYHWLKTAPDFVLAGMPGMGYQNYAVTLNAGDRLFFYTDGVTEALNEEDKLYGDERLIQILNQSISAEFTAEALIDYVKKDVDFYVGNAEQADDITMMALDYGEHLEKGIEEDVL